MPRSPAAVLALILALFTPAALCAQEPPAEAARAAPAETPTPPAPSGPPPAAPIDVKAKDTPNDAGGSLTVTWAFPEGAEPPEKIIVYRAEGGGPFEKIKETSAVGLRQLEDKDRKLKLSVPYRYRIEAVRGGQVASSEPSLEAASTAQWFRWDRRWVLLFTVVFVGLVVSYILLARHGMKFFIRRIAGLSAVDEAIGRATEMGKPVLFTPGLGSVETVSTVAALNLLADVTRKIIEYKIPLICPNRDPVVYTVAREIVREAYVSAGQPEAFNPDSVFFITQQQFAYVAAVDGIMVRERPATNFFFGYYYAEALILAETGASTGAIQIAGTDSIAQLPFFITACDYTLIGEELYAASAYLTREPVLMGTLKAQDYGKLILMVLLLVGSAAAIIFKVDVASIFN